MKKPKLMVIGLDSLPLEIIKNFANKGVTPTIASLMKKGSYGRAMPCYPAYTPNNWAVLASGSEPGTNLSISWLREVNGNVLSTFSAKALAGDNIFAAAARQGIKTLAIQYPSAFPPPDPEKNLVLAPLDKGLVSYAMYTGTQIELPIKNDKNTVFPLISEDEVFIYSASSETLHEMQIEKIKKALEKVGATQDGIYIKNREISDKAEALTEGVPVNWQIRVVKNGDIFSKIILTKENNDEVELVPDKWSEFFIENIPTTKGAVEGTFRLKALSQPEDGKLRIVRSEIYPTEMIASKPEIARELLEKVGAFYENPAFYTNLQGKDISKFSESQKLQILEDMRAELQYQVDWIIKASRQTQLSHGWEVFYLHWHWPDTALHIFLHWADPSAPWYNPELGKLGEFLLQITMELCDSLVKGLIECAGEETNICIVSDHGCTVDHYAAELNTRLIETGLAVEGESGNLDRRKSKALISLGISLAVDINTKDKGGPVANKDYERVQEEVINALLDWKTSEGKRVVAFALKRKDAPIVGAWGDIVGDVYYCTNSGFATRRGMGDKASIYPVPPGKGSSSHAFDTPTTSSDYSSNMAMFILCGPNVKENLEWDSEGWGVFRLIDIVPTICALSGIKPPLDIAGAVRQRLLKVQ